jgi:hypothetical protein
MEGYPIKYDYSELRGLIRAKYGTTAAFARAIRKSECSVSKKLNDRSEWTATDMRRSCTALGLSPNSIPRLFFTPKVENSQQ